MSLISFWLRVLGFAAAGGTLGCLGALVLSYLGMPSLNEHTPAWMAVIGALHGAIIGWFGSKYWVLLNNDAADLIDDENPRAERSDNPET